MKRENQALRLAQMMQNRVTAYPSYELALPLVEVEHSKLETLAVDDVVLLGLDTLEFVLINHEYTCANLVPDMIDKHCCLKIENTEKQPLKWDNSKEYQAFKISFGKLQVRKLDVGYKIDITQRSLQDVTVVVEEKKYASGSLVNVDGELAVKIDKVEK